MKRTTQALVVSQPKVSYLYVRARNEDESLIGKSRLEALLKCKVLHYTCVRRSPVPAFKVKVCAEDATDAIKCGWESGCIVDVWRCQRNGVLRGDAGGTGDGRQHGRIQEFKKGGIHRVVLGAAMRRAQFLCA